MKYKIVSSADEDMFLEMVNNYLKMGWELSGSLVVVMNGNTNTLRYFQAITCSD